MDLVSAHTGGGGLGITLEIHRRRVILASAVAGIAGRSRALDFSVYMRIGRSIDAAIGVDRIRMAGIAIRPAEMRRRGRRIPMAHVASRLLGLRLGPDRLRNFSVGQDRDVAVNV